MIYIITDQAERLCELVRDKDMGISKTVIGNGDCLMINQLFDGYLVENNMKLSRAAFEKYLSVGM